MSAPQRDATSPVNGRESSSTAVALLGPRYPYAGAIVSMVGYRHCGESQPSHRAPPVPFLRVFFGIDAPVIVTETETDTCPVRTHEMLGSLVTRPSIVQRPHPREGVQIFVHPLASRRLFGAPASRLPGLALDMQDVIGPSAPSLRQRLGDDDDWEQRFRTIGDFFGARGRSATGAAAARLRPEIVEGVRWIGFQRGNGRMDDLAAHVLLGPRQLRKLFVDELGVGPKVLSRLVRFQRSLASVRRSVVGVAGGSLSDAAARAGYSDHAHLDREFRALVGSSPSDWARQQSFTVSADRLDGES